MTTQYAGSYIYENGSLKFANHPEGYIEPDGAGGYNYVYQYKDHLGNVRLNYSDNNGDGIVESSEIRSEKNYYPFGLTHRGYNGQTQGTYHPYGFGGKEEQSELELEWLDFSARNYAAALGKWMNIDPLADSQYEYSPYHYTYNNPILYNDPTGMIGEYFGGRPVHATRVINETTSEEINIDDGIDFTFYVTDDEFEMIREAGVIPKELRGKHLRAFLKTVGQEMKKKNDKGNGLGNFLYWLVYDDIGDAIIDVSKKQYGKAILSIGAGKLKKLKKYARWIKKNKGKKLPRTAEGGKVYKNDGRNGGKVLPKKDANGKPITYKEYDINPAPKHGATRGKERMVIGSDGRSYYTRDHYKTFEEFKN